MPGKYALEHRLRKKVVIIGGGFAGLSAAKALSREPVDVVLIDRRNSSHKGTSNGKLVTSSYKNALVVSDVCAVLLKLLLQSSVIQQPPRTRRGAGLSLNFYAKVSPTISSLFFQRAFAFSGASA
jgi:glycine/D-amino acid oxidase-like deaminating enzyme